ncbi:MAG: hypothetical protein KAJ16_08335, partial [Calditrichia bacterium]|nr:hypothetical protein [Calditrichia bacterium]
MFLKQGSHFSKPHPELLNNAYKMKVPPEYLEEFRFLFYYSCIFGLLESLRDWDYVNSIFFTEDIKILEYSSHFGKTKSR